MTHRIIVVRQQAPQLPLGLLFAAMVLVPIALAVIILIAVIYAFILLLSWALSRGDRKASRP